MININASWDQFLGLPVGKHYYKMIFENKIFVKKSMMKAEQKVFSIMLRGKHPFKTVKMSNIKKNLRKL